MITFSSSGFLLERCVRDVSVHRHGHCGSVLPAVYVAVPACRHRAHCADLCLSALSPGGSGAAAGIAADGHPVHRVGHRGQPCQRHIRTIPTGGKIELTFVLMLKISFLSGRSTAIASGHAILAANPAGPVPLAQSQAPSSGPAQAARRGRPGVRHGHPALAAKLYRPSVRADLWRHVHASAHAIRHREETQSKTKGQCRRRAVLSALRDSY